MARCPTCSRRVQAGEPCPADGAVLPPSTSEAAAPVLPVAPALARFALERLLGSGGFADVWRGTEAGQPIAVKVARGHAAATLGREVELQTVCAPPAPAVVASGPLEDGRAFVAMALAAGESLASLIARQPSVPSYAWAIAQWRAVVEAVAQVHGRGIAHRDLKPENLLRADDGRVCVLDFGQAARTSASEAPPGGSIEYLAPEQLDERCAPDLRTDVYALGVLLFELLTLTVPFVGDAATIAYGHRWLRPRRASELTSVPPEIDELIVRCLAKSPSKRPRSAAELLTLINVAAPVPSALATGTFKRTLLATSRQPVVLLAAGGLSTDALAVIVDNRGGELIGRKGDLTLVMFSATRRDDPSRCAADAAEDIIEQGGRAALHHCAVAVRRGRSGAPTVAGTDVDKPQTWLPADGWSGRFLTAAYMDSAGLGSRPRARWQGHAALMAQAQAEALEALRTGQPRLLTLIGGGGLGKSRFAEELVAVVRTAMPGVEVRAVAGSRVQAGHVAPPSAATLLLIDDAHLADDLILDRVEHLVVAADAHPMVVLVTGTAKLLELRPTWGASARAHSRLDLGRLTDDEARELARGLLEPVEYPPGELIDRLIAFAEGAPGTLVDAVTALRRAGALRRYHADGGWYVAADAMAVLPTGAPAHWLATRELAQLTPDLAACVRLCAVLGATVRRDEVAWMIDAAEAAGLPATPVDADVALRELVGRGMGTDGAAGFTFRPSLRDAVYQMVPADVRGKYHQLAARYWRDRIAALEDDAALEVEDLAQLATHLAAAGEVDAAAAADLRLAHRYAAAHRYIAAERHFGQALAQPLPWRTRIEALRARGHARYRIDRSADARTDFIEAGALAVANEDQLLAVHAALDQAVAADWLVDYVEAAAMSAHAETLAGPTPPPEVAVRLLVARGRTAWRAERVDDTVALMREAWRAADACGDTDSALIAMIVLGPAAALAGLHDESRQVFETCIDRCTKLGDRLHLGAALNNRAFLWSAVQEPGRAIDDQRRAIAVARELGQPRPERFGSHNLGEAHLWMGQLEPALQLAQRALSLAKNTQHVAPEEYLLLVRVYVALGRLDDARALLALVPNPEEWSDMSRAHNAALQLVLAEVRDLDAWQPVFAMDLPGTAAELIEHHSWLVALLQRHGDLAAAASVKAQAHAHLPQALAWAWWFTSP